MAVSFAFLIMTAMKVLLAVCLIDETVQANEMWYNSKQSFGESIANPTDLLKRFRISPGKLLSTNTKQNVEIDPTLENIESVISMARKTSRSMTAKHRSKRVIFAGDDRIEVPDRIVEKCPYGAAVRLSTGCSGILVSPKHVLTSAHCLHNGSHYVEGYRSLRVGFLSKNRTTEWRTISSTKMSKLWKNGSDPSASRYDYALIRLREHHGRCFLPITPSRAFFSNGACRHRAIHFVGFDEDRKEGTALYRACRVLTFSPNLLYHCCDAQRGSSGAGVYEMHRSPGSGKYQRYVVGVFSGNRDIYSRRPPQHTCNGYTRRGYFWRVYLANYNAALRFNEQDVYHICTWMRRLGGENCKKFLKERMRRRRQARRRRERSKVDRCQGLL